MPLFTVEEARSFVYQGEAQLASTSTYPDALIEDAAARIADGFAQACGVAFVPTSTVEVIDIDWGAGPNALLLAYPRVTAITAVAMRDRGAATYTAFTTDELAGLLVSKSGIVHRLNAYWPRGAGAVMISYTHGYATPPLEIKRAALILAVNDLVSSNVSDRATQQTNEYGTYNLAVAGWREGQWYGLPVVDAVLARYSERAPGVG